MAGERHVRFGRYTLHPKEGLTRGRQRVRVTHKSLQVLHALVDRPGLVVTKEELFRLVWPDTAVSDAALTSCIQELRRALGDDARRPRFIETVHRRGFRFLAPLDATAVSGAADSAEQAETADMLVEREAAMAALDAAFEAARSGTRQLVFVTGEPGIGKTALVEAFAARAVRERDVCLARGDAIERLGIGEPYHPLLDALTRLCRQPGGGRFVEVLRRCAPTWLAEMPSLLTEAEQRALQRRTAGVTRERMLRELNDALETLTDETALVLWIDDLQWGDASTLEWLATAGQRRPRARLLVIATVRPGVNARVDALCAALTLKARCRAVPLSGLDEDGTRQLVAARFPQLDDAELRSLAGRVRARTEGHPLFIRAILDDLAARGLPGIDAPGVRAMDAHGLSASDARAGRAVDAPGLSASDTSRAGESGGRSIATLAIPESLRELIERQFDALERAEQESLEAASVTDVVEWSAAAVAAGVARPMEEVEGTLVRLARAGRFIRHAGTATWPDGTTAARFAFLHVLYRDVLRQRLAAGRHAELHRRLGQRLEAAFAGAPHAVAEQLAVHFELGGDIEKAIACLELAGRNASRRGAGEEARGHLERALALVASRPSSSSRPAMEFRLQVLLGGVLMAAQGWGAQEVERAFGRARDLAVGVEATPALFQSYWGLWLFKWGRGDLQAARDLAAGLRTLADRAQDPALRMQMHHAHWATAFCAGDFDAALEHAGCGDALARERQDDGHEHAALFGNHDASVCGRVFAARALTAAGRTLEAGRAVDDALAAARRLEHPFTLALALVFAAAVSQGRRQAASTLERASEAAALSAEHGFRLMHAWASALEAWARGALGGARARAATDVRAAVTSALATGSRQFETYLLGLLAEALLWAGQPSEGLAVIGEALERARATGERFYEAELLTLRAALLVAAGAAGTAAPVEQALRDALETARRQNARLFALRASLALGRVWRAAGRPADADALVEEARRAMPAGSASPDIDEALEFEA